MNNLLVCSLKEFLFKSLDWMNHLENKKKWKIQEECLNDIEKYFWSEAKISDNLLCKIPRMVYVKIFWDFCEKILQKSLEKFSEAY